MVLCVYVKVYYKRVWNSVPETEPLRLYVQMLELVLIGELGSGANFCHIIVNTLGIFLN